MLKASVFAMPWLRLDLRSLVLIITTTSLGLRSLQFLFESVVPGSVDSTAGRLLPLELMSTALRMP